MRLASRLALLAPIVLAFTVPDTASAQGWMADRSRREGPGIRVGNLELHPGLGVEAGYDTNVFYEDVNPEDSFLLRLTAHLDVSTLGLARRTEGESTEGAAEQGDGASRKIDFRGGVAASYYHFFSDAARDNVGLDAYLAATINPEGTFSVYVHDEFGRSIRPFVDRGPGSGGGVPTYARNRNLAGAEFRLQSRGGVLKGSLGYDHQLDLFQDDLFDYVNSHTHTMRMKLSWRFLPQTSLLSISEAHRQDYFSPADEPGSLLTDNWRVSSKIGLNGALTETLAFTALVGYAAGFYDVADDYDNVEATAVLKWKPRRTMSFSLGYNRGFAPSFLGNFVKSDRVFLNSQLLVSGRFLLGFDLSVAFAETGTALTAAMGDLGNERTRSDVMFNAGLYSEYRFTDWLAVTASVGYYGDFTDYTYTFPTMGATIPDPGGGYQKFEAWLGLRAFY